MTTLAEATTRMVEAGTSRKEKLKKAIRIGVSAVFGTVAVLLIVYWLAGAVNSNPQSADRQLPPTQTAKLLTPLEAKCNGLKKSYTFGPEWVKINDSGDCSGDLYYDELEVTLWARRPNSSKKLGPFGRGDKLPKDTEWVYSEGKTFPAQVALVPPRH